METPRDYLIRTDKKIYEAVQNGYDIRLEESEILEKMTAYVKSLLPVVGVCVEGNEFKQQKRKDQKD